MRSRLDSSRAGTAQNTHTVAYRAHTITHAEPVSLAGTAVFLNRMVNEFRDNILHIKGLAGFRAGPGRPAIMHAVYNKS